MTIVDTPRMSWQDFLNIPNGTRVFNHGASECVALANLYNEGVLGGGFVRVGSALQWWTNGNVAPVHGFSRVASNPQVGDIFIGSGGIYNLPFGHIGVVVRAWDGSTFGTMEQNVVGQVVSRHNRTMQNIDGFLRPVNQAPIQPPAPVLKGNQRVAGPQGANRRQEPSSKSAMIEPALKAGEVGNFVNWIRGEDPYGKGNNIWFQGVSGNWFYSGAFTDQGTHDLNDLNPAPPAPSPTPVEPPVEVKPEVKPEPEKPQTEEVEPSVKPEDIEHRPLPKPEEEDMTVSAAPDNTITVDQWVKLQSDIEAAQLLDGESASDHDLLSIGFWNYAGERIIKTFAMTASAILTTTGAVVVSNPSSANVFHEIGWVYLASVAGVSALNSFLVALSSFKNIVTIEKKPTL